MNPQKFARLILLIIFPIISALITYSVISSYLLKAKDPLNSKMTMVEVKSEGSFREFAKELEARGLVNTWRSLDLLARFKQSDKAIKAGEYELSPSMTPKQILAKLTAGEVFKRLAVVREGTSIWEIGAILEAAGVCPKAQFDASLTNADLMAQLGILADSFEGYLFPETYNYSKNTEPAKVIKRMVDEFLQVWTPGRAKRAEELNLSRHEIITLASIIEKESGAAAEQKRISSVFHNRLKLNMRLQSDPTVIYGIPNFRGDITETQLQTPSSYNTYLIQGLPPGPICNPGKTAIDAALNPEQTEYLYFVANGKGGHTFSKSLDEHNAAVQIYRQGLVGASATPSNAN